MVLGNLVSMIAGLLFGLGLGLAGMLDPGNVQGFLDVFGAWDPTLMFVMAGGIAVHGSRFIAPACFEPRLSWHSSAFCWPPA